jgi:chaperonin GroEL (HSP60 family)
VVPGVVVALIRALNALGHINVINEDQNHGIAKRALDAPLREIVTNSGDEPSVVLNQIVPGGGLATIACSRRRLRRSLIGAPPNDKTCETRTSSR